MPTETWLPYCGVAPGPGDLISRWNFDPALLAALGLGVCMVLVAYRREPGFRPVLLFGAVAALIISFVSPLCALSSALFSARVTHHLILMGAAAPILVWSVPKARLPPIGIAAATLVQTLVLWGWHAPVAYSAALANDAIYWIMQISLFCSAVAFWAAVRRAPFPSAAIGLLFAMLQMGLLGALLTFAPEPVYAPHLLTTAQWGLSPHDDQQLGGMIMWAPAAGLYLAAALALLWRSIGSDQKPA